MKGWSFKEMERSTVEHTAKIIGEHSACAKALKDAATHDGPVRFIQARSRYDSMILIEKLPKDNPL